MKSKLIKRSSLFLAIALLVVAVVPFMAGAAYAPVMPEEGTLVIHKYKITDPSEIIGPGNGVKIEDGSLDAYTPLENITFEATWVNPKTDNSYPETAASVTDSDLDTTKNYSATTDSDGIATMADLPAGVYLVKETVSIGQAPISPFLVQVPMTNPTGDGWMEEVHVYPKNQTMVPSKKADGVQFDPLDPANAQDVTWTINVPIPSYTDETEVFRIKDVIDNLLVLDTEEEVAITTVASREDEGTGTVIPSQYYTLTREDNTLIIEFTKEGIAYLGTQYAANEPYVRVVFKTALTDEALGKVIGNDVTFDFGNEDDYTTSTIPENEKPEIYTGAIKINKTKQDGTALEGAVFKVATSLENAKAGIYCQDLEKNDIVATTDENGVAVLRGISYGSDGNKPGDVDAHGDTKFYLVEVTAPTGYNLLHDPVEVGFNYELAEENGAMVNYFNNGKNPDGTNWTIVNTKGFKLPETGGTGIIVTSLLGTAMLSGVIITMARRKSKQNSQNDYN